MVRVLLRPVKRAELAVNVADVRVIDVPIDDVRDDSLAVTIEPRPGREIAPMIRERAEFVQRQLVKSPSVFLRDSFTCKDLVDKGLFQS
jgi:hypothetical protein